MAQTPFDVVNEQIALAAAEQDDNLDSAAHCLDAHAGQIVRKACDHAAARMPCQSYAKDAESLMESALAQLKSRGLKLTSPRVNLLKAMSQIVAPFSADEVFQAVSRVAKSSKFDLVTVYRSLSTFTEVGILARVDLDDGVVRYEWSDPSGHHHHHFVCTSCRKIEPLDLCSVDGPIQAQEQSLKRKGYSHVVHRLEFYGICPSCSDSQSQE